VSDVLVAGIGNLFFGDDGFGPEVAQRLARTAPAGARVVDFGIRGLHLAFELLTPVRLLIVVDCVHRGGAPGTIYVVEPTVDETAASPDAHAVRLPEVLASLRQLGGTTPVVRVVGCEPASIAPGIGLSAEVAAAIPAAIAIVHQLAERPSS
jgi:hydrogenase maturation protease